MQTSNKANPSPLRKPYIAPAVTCVPLVPEELFVSDCAKTPAICIPRGPFQKVKS